MIAEESGIILRSRFPFDRNEQVDTTLLKYDPFTEGWLAAMRDVMNQSIATYPLMLLAGYDDVGPWLAQLHTYGDMWGTYILADLLSVDRLDTDEDPAYDDVCEHILHLRLRTFPMQLHSSYDMYSLSPVFQHSAGEELQMQLTPEEAAQYRSNFPNFLGVSKQLCEELTREKRLIRPELIQNLCGTVNERLVPLVMEFRATRNRLFGVSHV